MSGYYFCSECGDGPHNTIYNPSCPNCYRPQNNSHQAIDIGHYAYGPDAHATASYATTDINTLGVGYPFDVSSLTAGLSGNNAPYNQCPKQPPNEQWVCCKCREGGGSVAMDKGCASCSNHWRCGGCTVYDASKKM
ncbi:hypothetical protein P3342_000852 [Pyrenophora teres f. teres]|uniref:Uncharacterized protein n=2 Tax=Pyrenophora teres f. teres TaxID=97479 RepID=E3RXZ7_PYRTT|nr:hypothetical protein PTT_14337 [Pyrenophora teres f. teres 0-1]KAE8836036.1 hypothetical protein HRS9139_04134 [Pyrenophora teres f. teres]CAA9957113.1 hypothetical protein PTMSG1_00721 [Pyrenophora teres f. maculata]KAE8837990.1 hypothetical protein PTNB85_05325 [Pyrenophora teres f. teres]KAE8839590.1 hypothetical protein HRS9122_06195 [Pyrenophora teres f. teres]